MKYPTIKKEGNISVIEGERIITFTDKNYKSVIFAKEGTYTKVRVLNDLLIIVQIENGKVKNYSIC